MTQGAWPEVLPTINDDFILTAKFDEDPPVLPAVSDDFDGLGLVKDMEFARGLLNSLGEHNSTNPYVSADGLTVFDDWSGVPAPTRHDVWG